MEEQLKSVDTYSVKCQSCGGTMIFDPDSQSLKCEHCGNTVDIQKDRAVKERDILEGFDKAETWDADGQATYKCENCGAVVIVNADEQASLCPFCGTSHVVKDGTFKGLKPQVVIPFAFGAETAEIYAKKWAKKRWFAPRKFKKNLSADKIHGVYEPCFTFDSDSESYYVGRVGERRTRVVGSGKNRRTETYIVYYHIKGVIRHFFDDVLVAANDNFNQSKLDGISPFDQKSYCVYENKYLSGFVAESYNKSVKDCWDSAKKIMDLKIRAMIKDKHHYDVVDYINVSTSHSDVTYKYLLVPVYVMNYRYNGKKYELNVNGVSGATKGKTPISPFRVGIAAIIGLAVFALLVFLFTRGE